MIFKSEISNISNLKSQIPNPQSAIRNPQLLQVSSLRVHFHTNDGVLKAVDGVSFEISAGETLGLVGESGCGKSVTAYSILQLLPVPPAEYAEGEIDFRGENLLAFGDKAMRRVRGNLISMIFQEPMSSLNPIMSIGAQITEAIREHRKSSRREAREIAIDMLRRVGISSPETRFHEYPHQLSGGMKQRAMIAMALVCRPSLLVADEPTTALDVTIQAQILELLNELQRELNMSVLLITHDLGVVAETCDRVAVMYAGKIVESAPVVLLFESPKHPYTHGLFRSLPTLGERKKQLAVIQGNVPSPLDFPSGCRFRTRCSLVQEVCKEEPPLREISPEHFAACHFAEEVGEMARGFGSP
ncbi:MAG: peptide ABC transporter ATP-binding protein [Acidobacteria bacterium]|nr:MAG: peptide ABC transporter ATP-binding protein [Acidobacteriota bacterium]